MVLVQPHHIIVNESFGMRGEGISINEYLHASIGLAAK